MKYLAMNCDNIFNLSSSRTEYICLFIYACLSAYLYLFMYLCIQIHRERERQRVRTLENAKWGM